MTLVLPGLWWWRRGCVDRVLAEVTPTVNDAFSRSLVSVVCDGSVVHKGMRLLLFYALIAPQVGQPVFLDAMAVPAQTCTPEVITVKACEVLDACRRRGSSVTLNCPILTCGNITSLLVSLGSAVAPPTLTGYIGSLKLPVLPSASAQVWASSPLPPLCKSTHHLSRVQLFSVWCPLPSTPQFRRLERVLLPEWLPPSMAAGSGWFAFASAVLSKAKLIAQTVCSASSLLAAAATLTGTPLLKFLLQFRTDVTRAVEAVQPAPRDGAPAHDLHLLERQQAVCALVRGRLCSCLHACGVRSLPPPPSRRRLCHRRYSGCQLRAW